MCCDGYSFANFGRAIQTVHYTTRSEDKAEIVYGSEYFFVCVIAVDWTRLFLEEALVETLFERLNMFSAVSSGLHKMFFVFILDRVIVSDE